MISCELIEITKARSTPTFRLRDESGVSFRLWMNSRQREHENAAVYAPLACQFITPTCGKSLPHYSTHPMLSDTCSCDKYEERQGHGFGWIAYYPERQEMLGNVKPAMFPRLGPDVPLAAAIYEWLDLDPIWDELNPLLISLIASRMASAAHLVRDEMVRRDLISCRKLSSIERYNVSYRINRASKTLRIIEV